MTPALWVLFGAALVLHLRLYRGVRLLLPVAGFALVLAGLEWLGRGAPSALGLRTVMVFLVVTSAARMVPWDRLARRARPGSRLFRVVLFLHITRHFAGILGQEARRLLVARSLCVRRAWGPGALRSLAWALAALLLRSLRRAERFYAALSLEGLAD